MYCWTKEEWMTRTYVFINELNLMSFLSRKKYLSLTFTNINPISTTFHNVLIQTLMFMAQTFQQNFELFLKLKLKHNIGPNEAHIPMQTTLHPTCRVIIGFS